MKRIYLLSTFALMLCGVMIWSCSQEETDDVPIVYRYSTEEITTLRSMADEYGIPEVRFKVESNELLPSIPEMEETFRHFAMIKSSFRRPMEMLDSVENNICYVSKRSVVDRFPTISETMKIKSTVDYGELTWNISWKQYFSQTNNKYECPIVSLSIGYSLSSEMQRLNYYIISSSSDYSIRGSELYVSCTCKIGRGISDMDVSYSRWVHPGFKPY